jgi:signal transduction histidine kinase
MSRPFPTRPHQPATPRVRKIVTGPLPPAPPAPGAAVVGAVAVAGAGVVGWEIVIPEAVLKKIVRNAGRALGVDRCALALFDVTAGELVTVAAAPTPTGELRRSRFRPGEGIAGEVARTRQPVLIDDVEQDRRFKRLGRDSIRSLICVPLIDSGAVLGTMTASSARPAAFNAGQLELLSVFADQAALAIAQAHRAEEVDRLKSAFLSTVSHELRTPLSSIRGFVEIILSGRTGPLTAIQRDFLESVQSSTKQLHRLVEDIMQLSLAESGQLRLECLPTDLGELTRNIARQLRPQAEAAGVTLELALETAPPPVECDAARIEQVLANLVGNAIKFTPAGGQITIAAGAADGGAWVAVRDTGPGIPESEQRKVFDRLYQVQHGLNRHYGGAGLGLTIAKHLVEGHGGRIDLASRVGRGSTFTVWLPARFRPPGR